MLHSSSKLLLTPAMALLFATACGTTDPTDGGQQADKSSGMIRDPFPFDSQGHRGARGLLPENTIAAAELAVELGMRTIELDLAVSRDSVLIVSHEPHFNTTICQLEDTPYDESTSLFTLTAADIQSVDCGTLAHPEFPYQAQAPGPKPTLEALVLAADEKARGRGLPHYNIEIKTAPELDGAYTPSPEAFAQLLHEELIALDIIDRATVQSFDPRPLAWFSENAPNVPLGGLVAVGQGVEAFAKTFNDDVDIYSPHHLMLTRGIVADYKAAGIAVIPWTVNDKSRMRTLISWGVNGIITDYPDRLAEVLAES